MAGYGFTTSGKEQIKMLKIVETDAAANACLLSQYAAGLGLVDTYWLEQIVSARQYEIRVGENRAGFFTITERERALTSFFLSDPLNPHSRESFALLMERFHPACAYLVTSDEPFFSLLSDWSPQFAPHAFFFDDGELPPAPACFPEEWILPARESDLADLNQSGFYGETNIHDPENQIYVLRDADGSFLGTGHIALWMRRVGREWGAVGMYADPASRNRGVGRSIILAMKELTRKQGLIPIAGCKFENTGSRRTLESCGFITKTRYLKCRFSGN